MSTNIARRLLPKRFVAGCFLAILGFACAATEDHAAAAGTEKPTGPWDVETLQREPEATWGTIKGLVQEVYYAGEPYEGKPTRVFAYYGRPEGRGPFPAVLLVHGGGGKAFREGLQRHGLAGAGRAGDEAMPIAVAQQQIIIAFVAFADQNLAVYIFRIAGHARESLLKEAFRRR